MKQVTIGIVPAPGLPATICDKLSEKLEKILRKEIPEEATWKVEVEIDQLTGAAEKVKEIMDQAIQLKETNNWDYVISLTDLPIFYDKFIVLADADIDEHIAQVSLPAFGGFPTPSKVQKTILHMVKELYYRHVNTQNNVQLLNKGIGIKEKGTNRFFVKLVEAFRFSSIQRNEFRQKCDGVSVRFVIHPKWNGRLKILSGMTVANRPWGIMPSYKKVIGLAFATGSYMLIFNTLWRLSALYGLPRFIGLMLLAIIGMVVWIVFAHNLWEKRSHYSSSRLRLLYNTATITTLGISVLIFYVSMFILFLFAVTVFVPADIFKEVIEHDITFVDYFKLAWLVTSAATVAGAIGAGLENPEAVRKSTYGYRQYTRSKKMQEREKIRRKTGGRQTSSR
ncbi:hypothetical protein P5G51_005340 [Virgibacillus sp. 179-BFC.A HS]|uniref:5,10-methylene-tetrahydrofolate dehydrogenase n=1 Tax=Tigheibacillus jepli TaxID=3035914 RepID=A0ABU5CEY7_9BACI|nr:hypothetical protein [Virgibacillus sp. 179-BFC.A HS]MDY0404899.1 hypothetical protein [Virgibacillus sp. 179-BFC.A HS]